MRVTCVLYEHADRYLIGWVMWSLNGKYKYRNVRGRCHSTSDLQQRTIAMSDEEALLSDSHTVDRNNKDKSPPEISKGASVASPDLVDTFSLFRTYLDSSLQSIKTEPIESQDSKVHDLSRKLRKDISSSLKSEGNRIQFDFNDELLSDVDKLYKRLTRKNDEKNIEIVDKLADKLRKRNKLIRIADSSPAGCATVKQYETNEIASDSDDEKRLRQAETRALKSIKDKKQHYKPYDNARSSGSYYNGPSAAAGSAQQLQGNFRFQHNQPFRGRRQANPWDVCYSCRGTGHWRRDCQVVSGSDNQSAKYTASSGATK